METITQFRMPDGSVMRLMDWVDKPVFSILELLSGFQDTERACFTYVVGETVATTSNGTNPRTATSADTNMQAPGGNVSTEEILVYAIKPEYFELQNDAQTPTDMSTAAVRAGGQPMPRASVLQQLANELVMKLMISQKSYTDAGIGFSNTGFGPMVNMNLGAAIAGTRTLATAGLPSQEAVRAYAMPHHVGGTEKYRLVLERPRDGAFDFLSEAAVPAALTGVVYRIRFYLDGLRKRPTA